MLNNDQSALLGNRKKGIVFVLSAPAGTGKTTLVEKLKHEFSCVTESVSYTTREPRGHEINGVHYNFVTKNEFKQKIEEGGFLEFAQVFGHYYGTSKKLVENLIEQKKHVFLVIDTQGAMKVQGFIDAVFIFLSPPSMEELKKRLEKRKTESEEVIEQRLSWAAKEIELAKYYDYHIVNKDLDIAYEILRGILVAEDHKTDQKP